MILINIITDWFLDIRLAAFLVGVFFVCDKLGLINKKRLISHLRNQPLTYNLIQDYFGKITPSTTWITPLLPAKSAATTVAPLIFTTPLAMETVSSCPFKVATF